MAIGFPAAAQTSEDVAWTKVGGCGDLRAFVGRYPDSRYFPQIKARLISLACLERSNPTPASPFVARPAPRRALDLLKGVAPPPLADLTQLPEPRLTLLRTGNPALPPCPPKSKPTDECRTQILGVSEDGARMALIRTTGGMAEWSYRDGDKGVYWPSDYSEPVVLETAELSRVQTLKIPSGVYGLQDWPMPDIANLVFTSDGARVVTQASMEGWTFAWDLASGKPEPGGEPQGMLRPSYKQKYLFATSVGAGNYCSIYVFDGDYTRAGQYSDDKRPINCVIYYHNATREGDVLAVSFSDDMSADPDGLRDTVAAVNWRADKTLIKAPGEIGAISPTATHLAVWAASRGKTPTSGAVYDLWSGKRVFTLSGHVGKVTSMAWSPDGERLATGGADAIVHLWNGRTGAKLSTFGGFPGPVCSLQFTPTGRGLIARCEKEIRVYDAATGRQIRSMIAGQDGVLAVEVSNDGSTLIQVRGGRGDAPTVEVWSLRD